MFGGYRQGHSTFLPTGNGMKAHVWLADVTGLWLGLEKIVQYFISEGEDDFLHHSSSGFFFFFFSALDSFTLTGGWLSLGRKAASSCFTGAKAVCGARFVHS